MNQYLFKYRSLWHSSMDTKLPWEYVLVEEVNIEMAFEKIQKKLNPTSRVYDIMSANL